MKILQLIVISGCMRFTCRSVSCVHTNCIPVKSVNVRNMGPWKGKGAVVPNCKQLRWPSAPAFVQHVGLHGLFGHFDLMALLACDFLESLLFHGPIVCCGLRKTCVARSDLPAGMEFMEGVFPA